jgi:hypothetical protein
MRIAGAAIWLILLTFFSGCSSDKNNPVQAPLRTDNSFSIPDELLQMVIGRFEIDLFSFTKETFSTDTSRMYKKYGSFTDLYFENIIRVGNKKLPLFRENILGFINDPDIKNVFKEVNKQYKDLKKEEEDFSIAFSRYKALFPDSLLPDVITMVSGFNYTIAVSDSSLAIGLDMYLGDSCRFYEWLSIPDYKKDRMNRHFIVSDAIRGFLSSTFPNNSKNNDLVSRMIYEGKIIYLTKSLLPHFPDHLVLAYSQEQEKWCTENEGKMWSHFIDKKLFYSTDFNDEVSFINDGPFTKGFNREAPARTGIWLGYRIVNSYMENNKKTSIQELFSNEDAHAIFNNSGYKPVRS